MTMNVERSRKLLKQLKYLVERYFPELDVEFSHNYLVLKVKDGDAGRSPAGNRGK